MLIRDKDGSLRCISERPGAFILFTQGYSSGVGEVPLAGADDHGHECYSVLGVAPRVVPLGSSLWRVRPDGSLMLVEDNHDSSD